MSRRLIRAALVVALCAVPAAAQQQARVQLNLSPAGQAVAKRYLGAPDPQMVALAKRAAGIAQQQKAVIAAPKLDVGQFASLLRQREQVQGQMMRRSNDRLLQMLRELNEADRVAFLRGMSNPTIVPAPAK